MSEPTKETLYAMIDNLEKEVSGVVKSIGQGREFSLAITKLEEATMWLRRAVERM